MATKTIPRDKWPGGGGKGQGERPERPPERKSGAKRQRIQLDFSAEAYERLLEIKERADASSNAEVVRNSLRVYEWFLEQKRNNYRIQLVKDNTVIEVDLLL